MPTDVFPSHRPQKANQYQFCLINIFSAKAFAFLRTRYNQSSLGTPLLKYLQKYDVTQIEWLLHKVHFSHLKNNPVVQRCQFCLVPL